MAYTDAGTDSWDQEDVPDDQNFEGITPIYWRMLVAPIRPKAVSKGGIVIPISNQEAQEHLQYVGKVVAMGGLAGKHERLVGEPNRPKVGDYVIYGRYAGQKLLYKGVRLLVCNDDEVLGIVSDPADLQLHV